MNSHFIDVALPLPKRQLFEFSCSAPIDIGCRVRVPFGRRELIGIVMGNKSSTEWPVEKIKSILDSLDEAPVFDKHSLDLLVWANQYYQHAIGDTLFTALPVKLRQGAQQRPEPLTLWWQSEDLDTELIAALSRAPKQRALFESLSETGTEDKTLSNQFGRQTINALADKGLIVSKKQDVTPDLAWHQHFSARPGPTPNTQQAVAISAVVNNLSAFHPSLLEGVTGSGKTEVYLNIIEAVLKTQRQVLVLVPEIGLTPQTLSRFEKRLNVPVGTLHSGMNDSERLQVWQKARSGELAVVIGTRSSIFTPFADLGLIIVDEEHDGSYKQQDGLRYHARNIAVMRANRLSIPLLLGSATPSLESLRNAEAKRYQHLTLSQRAGSALMPSQRLVDLKHQRLVGGLAPEVHARMQQHLSKGNQVLVFINRRGYSPALVCKDCGHVMECHRCSSSFTWHKQANRLHCHHCDAVASVPSHCHHCGSDQLHAVGMGTEQLEEHLQHLFKDYSIARIDSDNTRGKDKLSNILNQINQGDFQLLIGTQILAKGHHFPLVTLVVILDIDGALFSADYRAPEHLAQLITQVAGRAGRDQQKGEMWLQSFQPEHPLLQDLLQNGYSHFARLALMERQQAGLPPFTFQALFRAESHQQGQAFEMLQQVRHLLKALAGLAFTGPLPAPLEKRQGRFRMQLVVTAQKRQTLQRALTDSMANIQSLPLANKVRWSVDIDPMDFS